MNAEEAIKNWAASRLNIKADSIRNVDFGTQEEGYCNTCSYTVGGVEVSYLTGKKTRGKKPVDEVKYSFISLGGESFTDVLKEILDGS